MLVAAYFKDGFPLDFPLPGFGIVNSGTLGPPGVLGGVGKAFGIPVVVGPT